MPAEQKRSTKGPRPVADDLAGLVYRGRPLQVLRVEVAEAIRRAIDGRPDTIRRVLPIVDLYARLPTAIANHAGDGVPRGALAAHAVAFASVALLDELSAWLRGSEFADQTPNWRDREWQSFGVLAASIEAAARAMVADAGAVDWSPFLLVGMPQTLAALGTHASAHHAVRAVLRDAWSRLAFELDASGFLQSGETWPHAVGRLQGDGPAKLRATLARLQAWREHELPAMRWPAWDGVRNLLEAEFARACASLHASAGTDRGALAHPAGEAWLPIDEAARLAGLRMNRAGRCDVARRAAKWKRHDPLPTMKVEGTLRARVEDCRAWKPKIEAAARSFGRNGSPQYPATGKHRVPLPGREP